MPESATHLTEWALEQLAEGTLPPPEERKALGHLERCTRCSAELEGYRSLFAALSDLPRFAPSADFSDAVMARVRVAPRQGLVLAGLRRWLPTTRRGWIILAAALAVPALPVVGMMLWLLTHPLVSTESMLQWLLLEGTAAAQAGWAAAAGWSRAAGVTGAAQSALGAVRGIPMNTWMMALGALALVIPLSVWTLVRLARTPNGDASYAN